MEEKKNDVRYLTSLAMAVADPEGVVHNLQFTVIQEVETKKLRCFFDVVDPSKIKLAE